MEVGFPADWPLRLPPSVFSFWGSEAQRSFTREGPT